MGRLLGLFDAFFGVAQHFPHTPRYLLIQTLFLFLPVANQCSGFLLNIAVDVVGSALDLIFIHDASFCECVENGNQCDSMSGLLSHITKPAHSHLCADIHKLDFLVEQGKELVKKCADGRAKGRPASRAGIYTLVFWCDIKNALWF